METHVLDSNDAIKLLKDTEPGKLFMNSVISEMKTAEDERSKHRLAFVRWYKKRFGVRPSVVNWPWRNAANLHLPFIDTMIRRAKPKYIRLVEQVPPAMFRSNIRGDDLSLVRAMERKFNEHLQDDVEIVEKVALGADRMLERGFILGKVVQEFTPRVVEEVFKLENLPESWAMFLNDPQTTDDMIGNAIANRFEMDPNDMDHLREIRDAIQQFRSGKQEIRFRRKVDMTQFPSLYMRDPLKVTVPADTTDIRFARLIRDRLTYTENQIEAMGESNVWNRANVQELLNKIGERGDGRNRQNPSGAADHKEQVELQEDQREGISPVGFLPDVDEYYGFFKWPGDMLASPSVLTINSQNTDLPLRFIKYPYVDQYGRPDHWPFSQVCFEKISERYHSTRGLPQMLDSIQTEINNNHNAKQNHMTIATSLNLKARRNSNVSTNWIPGQPLWLTRMDDAEPMQIGSKDVSFDNEERVLKSWGEGYVGVVDSGLSGPTGLTEPRTRKEIEEISEIQSDVAYGDVVVFQIGMGRIYNMLFNRWMQYGPEKIFLQGADGSQITLEKEEVRRRFRIKPMGTLYNSSYLKRKNESAGRLQLYAGDPYINQYELRRQALVDDDERVAETLLVPAHEAQQNQIERQIFENGMIMQGYTVAPKLSDDDASHIAVIDDLLKDPKKRRTIPPDRVEALLNHRQAHLLAIEKKKRETTRGGRAQQEISNVNQGIYGRAARNSRSAEELTAANSNGG